jgi:hypothetical protein
MKSILMAMTAICFLSTPMAFGKEELSDVHKKHRQLRHEEKKKWSKMEEECKEKYPKGLNPTDKDYDARFKCDEAVKDAEQAFENNLKKEICEKFQISCKKE